MDLDEKFFSFLFRHIFLPPKLPQAAEHELHASESRLVALVKDVMNDFVQSSDLSSKAGWNQAISICDSWIGMDYSEGISQKSLESALLEIHSTGAVACHIRAQNCGMIFSYIEARSTVIVDAFEVSAQAEPVIASEGLLRCFPGISVVLSAHKFRDRAFCSYLASSISKLDAEEISMMQPKSVKAGTKVDEYRDTAHPGLITEGLMMQLLALGALNEDSPITKSVHDEVNWSNAYLPWRRSPVWLVLRVALQTVLRRSFLSTEGRTQYKNFILYFITAIGAKALLYTSSRKLADRLGIVRAKLGRRIYKMKGSVFSFVADRVHSTTQDIVSHLEMMQQIIKPSAHSPVSIYPTSASRGDLHISLAHCQKYIEDAMGHSPVSAPSYKFDRRSESNMDWLVSGLPLLKEGPITALIEFEDWIDKKLQQWSCDVQASPTACDDLHSTLKTYWKYAETAYESDPQPMSVAILVLLELWMVIDKMVIEICPLMKKYSPEIPRSFLQPLLLPRKSQMQRATMVENHIYARHNGKIEDNPSIFADPCPKGFSVQYSQQSEIHRALKQRIEKYAEECKERKREEWVRLSEWYDSLRAQANNEPEHRYGPTRKGRWGHLENQCRKCSLNKQAHSLKLRIFEHPLPKKAFDQMAAVFELDIPEWFSSWRDATWTIIHDTTQRATSCAKDVKKEWLLYEGTKMFAHDHNQRVTLGSDAKSFNTSHYRSQRMPVPFESVCLPNAFNLRLFDKGNGAWITEQRGALTVKRLCTIALPEGAYSSMQRFLDLTTHSQNQIIVNQQDCDSKISLHEFIAFGCLRSGESVQWYNILRELASSTLPLNEPAVLFLIKQAAWEFGTPSENVLRRSHQAFEDPTFSDMLLAVLHDRVEMIEGNWNEHYNLELLTIIGLRLLTLSTASEIIEKAAGFLRRCREVAIRWCEQLISGLHDCSEYNSLGRQHMIVQIAFTCQTTYDVDVDSYRHILNCPRDVFCFVRSSVLMFENSPSDWSQLPEEIRRHLKGSRKICFLINKTLCSYLKVKPATLNEPIEKSVGCLELSTCWRFLGDGWVETTTLDSLNCPQIIHYNSVTGELLVDGCPPGRLPPEYLNSALYTRLFGSRVLQVIPSSMPGARFVSAQKIDGLEIHFEMRNDELVVRTRKGNQTLHLIPCEVLMQDFPAALVTDHFHWLDLATGIIEFRPKDQPWIPSAHNWHLIFDPEEPQRRFLYQDLKLLVDVHSSLFACIAESLQLLDSKQHITVFQTEAKVIEAELNRMRLRFFINKDGTMESKEYHSIVDGNQDIGCFVGLRNKLVLRGKIGSDRSVVVPYGRPESQKTERNVDVTIHLPDKKRVRYICYALDPHLQILRGPPDLLASLYQAYLHAVTAFPLPDPLTGRSGTEEALRILRQESLKSSLPLSEDCVSILHHIANLTPRRVYYPTHRKVMQTVHWCGSLGQLAQHGDFRALAEGIVEYSSKFSEFYDKRPCASLILPSCDLGLLNRARALDSRFRHSDYGGTCISLTKSIYHARDCDKESSRSKRVYEIAALVREWPSAIHCSRELVRVIRDSNYVCTVGTALQDLTCVELLDTSIEKSWVSMYTFVQSVTQAQSYSLISIFGTVAFGGKVDQSFIRGLLLIAFSGKFASLIVPKDLDPSLRMTNGSDFIRSEVEKAFRAEYEIFNPGNSASLSSYESWERVQQARNKWDSQMQYDIKELTDVVKGQWPCRNPRLLHVSQRINEQAATQKCRELCNSWMQNRDFLAFVREVERQLLPLYTEVEVVEVIPRTHQQFNPDNYYPFRPPSLLELVKKSEPRPYSLQPPPIALSKDTQAPKPTFDLLKLADFFKNSPDNCYREYGGWLSRSIQALYRFSQADGLTVSERDKNANQLELEVKRQEAVQRRFCSQQRRDELWFSIVSTLKLVDGFQDQCSSTVSPSITVWSVLSLLRSSVWAEIPVSWKHLLVAFGKSISNLRRCERLIDYIDAKDADAFYKELENPGYENWDPVTYPDWLLLEIENNIMIRKCQVEVAIKMIEPEDKESAVSQLNMGEGKTSVITPMAASVLANGNHLLRILVLKPLLPQSGKLLSQRLGGLLNRRVYHIPFSRQTTINSETITSIQTLTRQCRESKGILIALPEQILSFRLVGLDCAERSPCHFKPLIALEHELQERCRNLIDESDEVLDSKFQLVYTVGTQQVVDGLSERWETTQYLLSLVANQARRLQVEDSGCIEVDRCGYRYPLLRFLKSAAIEKLTYFLIETISQNGIPGLPFNQWSPAVRQATLEFILHRGVAENDQRVIQRNFNKGIFMTKLLVLRGLFAFRILEFVLTAKRWLVDYGLHPSRCMMAVPYRAKGVPSSNAEFGHPDVAISLTCLSYYYEGLTVRQLRECFGIISKENDPPSEYQNWIKNCVKKIPQAFRALSGVNLKDNQTFEQELYPLLRHQKDVIDFYLSRLVFPREAKEFPRKLSMSAWDIPSQPGQQITTGFSGTNDNRFLLPHSIKQRDLGHLLHTNAMVLGYLLQDRNRKCILAQDGDCRQLSVDQLLRLICRECCARVLIDVGAQILEATNESVARLWLSMTPDENIEASVFFDDKDEIMVIDRDSHVESLSSSSFRHRLGSCLVFLDQHHSRGVDLRLPPETRAAVTLGPRLTKDRLVQACNRLRGLGKSQSVVFLVPPEVRHSMASLIGSPSSGSYTSVDVLKWAMIQTCLALDTLRPLWANHGLQFYRRTNLWQSVVDQHEPSKAIVAEMQEPEARSLCDLYAPWAERVEGGGYVLPSSETLGPRVQELLQILQSTVSTDFSHLHEEQEREISHEVEREQQLSRPPSYKPYHHEVHNHIRHFVQHGRFPSEFNEAAVKLAFLSLRGTSVWATGYPVFLGASLYVSGDFERTVANCHGLSDEFCKPVNWILSSIQNGVMIILSQYEANALLPQIRQSKNTTLHIYTPRLTKTMRSFGRLDFYSIGASNPRLPSAQAIRYLELFAGSLYFASFAEYKDFRLFLGLLTDRHDDLPDGLVVTSEGFVDQHIRLSLRWPVQSPFTDNPLPFLRALIHMRARGQGYQQTHVGSIIEARPLTADRF